MSESPVRGGIPGSRCRHCRNWGSGSPERGTTSPETPINPFRETRCRFRSVGFSGSEPRRSAGSERGRRRASAAGHAATTVQLDVIRTTEELEALAGEWDALVRAMPRPSPFLLHGWVTAWWRHYGAGRGLAVVVAGATASSPARLRSSSRRRGTARVARFLGAHESALGDLLLAEGEPPATAAAAAGGAAGSRSTTLDVFGLPGRSALGEACAARLRWSSASSSGARMPGRLGRRPTGEDREQEAQSPSPAAARSSGSSARSSSSYGRTRAELEPLLRRGFLLHDLRWHGRPDGSTFGTPEGTALPPRRAAPAGRRGRAAHARAARRRPARSRSTTMFVLGGADVRPPPGLRPRARAILAGLVTTLETLRLAADERAHDASSSSAATSATSSSSPIGSNRSARGSASRGTAGALASRQRILLIEARKTLKRSERLQRLYLRGWSGLRPSRSSEGVDSCATPLVFAGWTLPSASSRARPRSLRPRPPRRPLPPGPRGQADGVACGQRPRTPAGPRAGCEAPAQEDRRGPRGAAAAPPSPGSDELGARVRKRLARRYSRRPGRTSANPATSRDRHPACSALTSRSRCTPTARRRSTAALGGRNVWHVYPAEQPLAGGERVRSCAAASSCPGARCRCSRRTTSRVDDGFAAPPRWPHWIEHPGPDPAVSFEVSYWTAEDIRARKVWDVNWMLRKAQCRRGRRERTPLSTAASARRST